jgi:hypothetical protein
MVPVLLTAVGGIKQCPLIGIPVLSSLIPERILPTIFPLLLLLLLLLLVRVVLG